MGGKWGLVSLGCQRHRRTGVKGNAAHFPQVHVGRLLANHFAQRLGVGLDGNLVGHGAGGAEQASLHPEAAPMRVQGFVPSRDTANRLPPSPVVRDLPSLPSRTAAALRDTGSPSKSPA